MVAEIVGHSPGAAQAGAHEPLHHVDGWQLYLYIPHHDGGHDVHAPSAGLVVHTAE